MNRRRIALVTGAGLFGGHFNQGVPALMELVTNLAQRHELHVFAGNLSSDAAKKSLNYKLQRLPGRLRFPAALASIAKAHARKKFDLIHGFWGTAGGFYAVAAGKLLKVPSVVSLLGGEAAAVTEIGYGSMLSPRLASRLRWVCGQADAVTALSNFQISRLQENGFDVTDIQRIPLGADNEKFAYSERQWSAPWRFLHVANINEVKDQVTLLRAFELIHRAADAKLTIVGPDYLDGLLQTVAKDLNIAHRVKFAGAIPHSQLPSYYRDAHVLLHSSLYESQAVVALEAMASGVAICATDVGMFADLKGECCVTVNCGDYEGLASSTLQLLQDRARIQALVTNGRSWAELHSSNWTAEQYCRLYDSSVCV